MLYRANLPKNLVLSIYSYLRISEIIKISQSCSYLYECSKSIWNDSDFFKEVQTDKLSYGELKNIFEKGGRMGHVKQLRNIYQGKSLRSCREKIKIKVQGHNSKPITGNLLELFEVGTRIPKACAFLLDNHLQEVLNSSFRSLISIKLQSCRFISKFYDISKCSQLTSLSITDNSYFSNDHLRIITKNCSTIEYLDLSGCDGLDQAAFKLISKLSNLKTFLMNNYKEPFGDLQCLKPLTNLTHVSLENSCIMDLEGVQMIKELSAMEYLNINGCEMLTDFFLMNIMTSDRNQRISIDMKRTNFGNEILKEWEIYCEKANKS